MHMTKTFLWTAFLATAGILNGMVPATSRYEIVESRLATAEWQHEVTIISSSESEVHPGLFTDCSSGICAQLNSAVPASSEERPAVSAETGRFTTTHVAVAGTVVAVAAAVILARRSDGCTIQ